MRASFLSTTKHLRSLFPHCSSVLLPYYRPQSSESTSLLICPCYENPSTPKQPAVNILSKKLTCTHSLRHTHIHHTHTSCTHCPTSTRHWSRHTHTLVKLHRGGPKQSRHSRCAPLTQVKCVHIPGRRLRLWGLVGHVSPSLAHTLSDVELGCV